MDITVIKARLRKYIEFADDEHLEALYVLLEKKMESQRQYDAATLEMFYQRREKYLNGESKSYTVEEVFAAAREMKKNKGI